MSLICLECETDNRDQSKFCKKCGKDLELLMKTIQRCPFCDEKIRVNAIKCRHCGATIGKVMSKKKEFTEKYRQVNDKSSKYNNMVFIYAGEFIMGSKMGKKDENPPHKIYMDDYYIDKYPITVAEYRIFCKRTSHLMPDQPVWNEDSHPVVNVNWYDANEYAKWAGKRLPTEAEWEKACRAGSTTEYCFGADELKLGEYCWYENNSGKRTHSIGQKQPNKWGLYDMHGNVWEWCNDWYEDNYYGSSPASNPQGPDSGNCRIMRGGSWRSVALYCRSADRGSIIPDIRCNYYGFRCASGVG